VVVDQTQGAGAVRTLSGLRPGTPFWRVNREWLISLGGARAVLLELAHPLIAEGVAAHSRYQADPFGRLFRTLRTMTDLTCGDPSTAQRAARRVQGCHRRVQGALAAAVGPFAAGTAYTAQDSLWAARPSEGVAGRARRMPPDGRAAHLGVRPHAGRGQGL
jgi:uncharacterized protein (DUF2236 family)